MGGSREPLGLPGPRQHGSRLSATIQAFSSSVQRRRRPTPVITSIRRKPSSFVLVIRLPLRIGAGPAPLASGPSSSSPSAGPQGARQTTLTVVHCRDRRRQEGFGSDNYRKSYRIKL